MKYKLTDDVFFKKISDDLVSIIKYNDDDFIYKLENVVAKIFVGLAEGSNCEQVKKQLKDQGKNIKDEIFDKIVNDLVALSVLEKE